MMVIMYVVMKTEGLRKPSGMCKYTPFNVAVDKIYKYYFFYK